MQTMLAKEILAKLTSARQVLLVCHRRPDPDSLGSAAAIGAFLEHHKIPHKYYCPTPFPQEQLFFGIDAGKIFGAQEMHASGFIGFDLICAFDASDLKHVGLDMLNHNPPQPSLTLREGADTNTPLRVRGDRGVTPFLINFDHHVTNTQFGNLNVIDIACASTTELIYHFFEALRFPISPRVATYLLAGLLVDTDHFMNPATTASSLTTAAHLISRGVSLSSLRQFLFERRGIGTLQLIGEVLSRLRKHEAYGTAVSYITDEDLIRYNVGQDDLDGIANILNSVGDAKVMILLHSFNGVVKGSFRTTRQDIDVGRLAELFGGGGHRKAAGFRIQAGLRIEGKNVRIA